MPVNNNLKPTSFPMKIRFNEEPATRFKNNLDSIKITLLNGPTMYDLRCFLPMFLEATWAETPYDAMNLSLKEKDELIIKCIKGEALPTALETVRLTFLIEGISLQEVTHILRYRNASFSADCSADKWWTYKAALVPSSVEQSTGKILKEGKVIYDESKDFLKRYKQIVEDSKQLYCDMIDSKEISIMDARYILPRCLETYYFMSMNLKDALHFIYQRIDKQIQPETDNVMAYLMLLELLKRYPILTDIVDIHATPSFYVKMARTGKTTNLYIPDKDADKFEYNEEDFLYGKYRNQLNGTDTGAENHFDSCLKYIEKAIKLLNKMNKKRLEEEYSMNK